MPKIHASPFSIPLGREHKDHFFHVIDEVSEAQKLLSNLPNSKRKGVWDWVQGEWRVLGIGKLVEGVGEREEKRNAAVGWSPSLCCILPGWPRGDIHRAEWEPGQQLRFDRELKNELPTEQREGSKWWHFPHQTAHARGR